MRISQAVRVLTLALTGTATVAGGPSIAAPDDVARWQWLNDTFWYVPNEYLLALASSPSLTAPIPVTDQTVYHIEYKAGYFWGTTAVSYMGTQASAQRAAPACLQLVGSVTPEGQVHLTFTPLPASSTAAADRSTEPTVGLGVMTRQQGEWTMENQMSTVAAGNVLLTHWAYMHQCKHGDACFSALPGVGVSIPEFLGQCVKAGR